MNITKIFFTLILLVTISSCENIVVYEGIVVDADNDSVISDVKVLVIQNNTIQDNYGRQILDTMPKTKRDSLRKLNVKDNFSKFTYDVRGFYFRKEPIKSDSLGKFNVWLHEGCVFGCPDYEIKFEKEGYEDFKLKGDWKSNNALKIKLKSK